MQTPTRRQFFGLSATLFASANLVSARNGFAASPKPAKTLNMYNTHTGESIDMVFEENGKLIPARLLDLNYFLRDHRQNEERVMDSNLFLQLHELQQRLGPDNTIEIVSGYRSLKTNNMLRRTSSGVAKNSYHVKGQAIDLRIQGVKTTLVRDTAYTLSSGGVGYYANSNFVHIDTGPVRAW